MATVTVASSRHTTPDVGAKGHIGLVVLGAIAAGLALGLVLVLGVFGGAPEHVITGAALLALGSGFALLAAGARRFSDQPQPWALAPAVGAGLAGLALWVLAPGEHVLALAGW